MLSPILPSFLKVELKKTAFKAIFAIKTAFLAQRKGFEPLYTFLHNTISNRARSAAPPSLQQAYLLYTIHTKKSTVFRLNHKKISVADTFSATDFCFTLK